MLLMNEIKIIYKTNRSCLGLYFRREQKADLTEIIKSVTCQFHVHYSDVEEDI